MDCQGKNKRKKWTVHKFTSCHEIERLLFPLHINHIIQSNKFSGTAIVKQLSAVLGWVLLLIKFISTCYRKNFSKIEIYSEIISAI